MREDIIEKVEHSERGSPTVPTVNANGDLRICVDYSVPTLEELLTNFSGGKKFTKINLS